MTHDEWFAAARGTVDPGVNDGLANSNCNTRGSRVRNTGSGAGCVSGAGAQDLIGNLWEWTVSWYANAGAAAALPTTNDQDVTAFRVNAGSNVWGADYGDDRTWNIASATAPDNGGVIRAGLPAATLMGGDYQFGAFGGTFAMSVQAAPSFRAGFNAGFRCAMPR